MLLMSLFFLLTSFSWYATDWKTGSGLILTMKQWIIVIGEIQMSCKVTNVTVRLLQLLQNLSVLVWFKLSTPLSHTNREMWTLNTEMWAVKDFWRCNYRSHFIPGVPVRRAIVLFFVKIKCWFNVSHWAGSLGQLESHMGVTGGLWTWLNLH